MGAPKRPMSAYFLFSNAVREQVQNDLDSTDFGRVAKEIKKMWDALSESEKGKYTAKAEKAKASYAKALAKYKKSKKFAQYQETLAAFKEQQKLAKKQMREEAKNQVVVRRKK